jgi:hypothetical protein
VTFNRPICLHQLTSRFGSCSLNRLIAIQTFSDGLRLPTIASSATSEGRASVLPTGVLMFVVSGISTVLSVSGLRKRLIRGVLRHGVRFVIGE